eukprot:93663-Rhodomonas_salina.1
MASVSTAQAEYLVLHHAWNTTNSTGHRTANASSNRCHVTRYPVTSHAIQSRHANAQSRHSCCGAATSSWQCGHVTAQVVTAQQQWSRHRPGMYQRLRGLEVGLGLAVPFGTSVPGSECIGHSTTDIANDYSLTGSIRDSIGDSGTLSGSPIRRYAHPRRKRPFTLPRHAIPRSRHAIQGHVTLSKVRIRGHVTLSEITSRHHPRSRHNAIRGHVTTLSAVTSRAEN